MRLVPNSFDRNRCYQVCIGSMLRHVGVVRKAEGSEMTWVCIRRRVHEMLVHMKA